MAKTTPLMVQYYSIKKKYKNAVLFFRMGDFYEMFDEDAKIGSDVLGLTLTSRAHGKSSDVPLAGFPHHALELYLSKMLKAGHKVAICEQVEDPKKAKGIVKRAVLEVVTPGTATSENVIDEVSHNYLISLFIENGQMGMSGVDISTGDFFLTEGRPDNIVSQAQGLNPSEIIVSVEQSDTIKSFLNWNPEPLITKVDDYFYSRDYAYQTLIDHFKTVSLKGFGCEDHTHGISAAGAALKYLQSLQEGRLGHVNGISTLNSSNYMVLDNATRRNLEILNPMNETNRKGSLLSVLDQTVTKMGARLLKMWLVRPLLDRKQIQLRHQGVRELVEHYDVREKLRVSLKRMLDIERITAKVNANKANPRDVKGLADSIKIIPEIIKTLKDAQAILLQKYRKTLKPLDPVIKEIEETLVDEPPASINDGRLIREGCSRELDELKKLSRSGKQWISELQETERQKTGIPSLKINYNKVFGYYIEVTRVHTDKVPDTYIRKQTLVNAERYITPDMKEQEEKILTAEEKIKSIESELFEKLRKKITSFTKDLQTNADITGNLDVLVCFAQIAEENRYCMPEMVKGTEIILTESRHPVVEQLLPVDEPFIPNDYRINTENSQVHIITGPNMAGKSTILRQIGLCVLMAQIGSFVPAESAKMGVVDRIFTRVGAHDDVTRGESTFLIEMLELANILNNATNSSLLLLDEIGRGTSTFDGLSIAWATVEFIHNAPKVSAKTLFATHYHELTSIAKALPRVDNFHVQVNEFEDSIIFLHKLVRGGSDHSYGIQVAKMAGVPESIISRAKTLLANLESTQLTPDVLQEKSSGDHAHSDSDNYQVNLFTMEDTLLRQTLHNLDPESITPREAIQTLFELKGILFGKNPSQ